MIAENNESWSIHGRILPYLELGSAYNQINLSASWNSQAATGIPTLRTPAFLCPSEANDTVRLDALGKPLIYPHTYGFNFGTWLVYDPRTNTGGDGSFYVNSRLSPADFRDGLSNTLCAAEVKAFTPYVRNTNDPGLTPPAAPLAVTNLVGGGQFKLGPSLNDNTGHTEWCDGRVHHSGITSVFAPNTPVLYQHSDGRTYDIDYNSRQEGSSAAERSCAAITARSYHTGGVVNTTMMDGSVREISSSIGLPIWRAQSTRAGGEATTPPLP